MDAGKIDDPGGSRGYSAEHDKVVDLALWLWELAAQGVMNVGRRIRMEAAISNAEAQAPLDAAFYAGMVSRHAMEVE